MPLLGTDAGNGKPLNGHILVEQIVPGIVACVVCKI